MEQHIQIDVEYDHQWNHIEYVKKMVDDIYQNKLFYSFSLHSLELSRRFIANYNTCKTRKEIHPSGLKHLSLLAEKLEEKLASEGSLIQ